MPSTDVYIMLGTIFATGLMIRWTQNRPVEGPFGVMDLIVAQQDPRDRLLSVFASIILPFFIGAMVGILAPDKAYIAALGTGLGAMTSVATAFFRPEILAPPIRNQLHLAQIIYGFFVVSYVGLGALGASVSSYIVGLILRNHSLINSVTANLISWGIVALISGIVRVNRVRTFSRLIFSAPGYPISAQLKIRSLEGGEPEETFRRIIHNIVKEEIEAVQHEIASTGDTFDA